MRPPHPYHTVIFTTSPIDRHSLTDLRILCVVGAFLYICEFIYVCMYVCMYEVFWFFTGLSYRSVVHN